MKHTRNGRLLSRSSHDHNRDVHHRDADLCTVSAEPEPGAGDPSTGGESVPLSLESGEAYSARRAR